MGWVDEEIFSGTCTHVVALQLGASFSFSVSMVASLYSLFVHHLLAVWSKLLFACVFDLVVDNTAYINNGILER